VIVQLMLGVVSQEKRIEEIKAERGSSFAHFMVSFPGVILQAVRLRLTSTDHMGEYAESGLDNAMYSLCSSAPSSARLAEAWEENKGALGWVGGGCNLAPALSAPRRRRRLQEGIGVMETRAP
jgi:hypothetical protein